MKHYQACLALLKGDQPKKIPHSSTFAGVKVKPEK